MLLYTERLLEKLGMDFEVHHPNLEASEEWD
jgi:hypothetical protein